MAIIPPLIIVGGQVKQLPSSDRVPSDVDLGGNKHYRGSVVPTNPSVGDTWDEETSGAAWVRTWFWNGSYWLSTQEFNKSSSLVSLGGVSTMYHGLPSDANIFVLSFEIAILLGATNSTLSYWTLAPSRATSINTSAALTSALSSANVAASSWWIVSVAINNHINIAATTSKAFKIDAGRVGTPTNISGGIEIRYRLARI